MPTASGWSDLGSTNGTFLNDAAEPLAVGKLTRLADGDRVHLGAWTTISLHAPDTGKATGGSIDGPASRL